VKNVYQIVILLMCFTTPGVSFAGGDKLILGRPAEWGKLVDSVYEGSNKAGPNKALVKVTVKDKRLVKIDIIKHSVWKGKKAESIIPMRILDYSDSQIPSFENDVRKDPDYPIETYVP
jgi:hypothetical protein